ncbi:hypothetical protein RHMOL_Rhmol07G0109400 [Rhododendron molle]|uniref:Uncharacterized protein n=1 Tax=Rhododendron molle TaxID=49168 RepID=A0ACC0N0T4_RHOML|nr:hypothetical protein RHMOL_Rhmol07G0109400 [Rhododendron molle]
MTLKIYADRMSQPSRAVIIFCKVNGIEFEEIKLDIAKRQHHSSEFKEINPFRQVPAIVDGRFKLFESHAILRYLACAFPGVADHWYPADLFKRAKIESVLDWHHSNLRRGAGGINLFIIIGINSEARLLPKPDVIGSLLMWMTLTWSLSFLIDLVFSAAYVLHSTLAPALGLKKNPQAAAEGEKILSASLEQIESIWLKGNGRFLLGSFKPSIADLSLVCELMQLEVVDEKDRDRILGPHKKVKQWIEDTNQATRPHFDEVHAVLFKLKAKLQLQKQQMLEANNKIEYGTKTVLPSKM